MQIGVQSLSGELTKLFILFYVVYIYFILHSIVRPLYIEGKVNDINHRIYTHAPHAIVGGTTTNTITMSYILLKIRSYLWLGNMHRR